MSGRPRREKEEEKDSGLGLAGGLLLAGGAAAVGFLAYKLFNKDEPTGACPAMPTARASSNGFGARSSSPPACSSSNINNTRARMDNRRKIHSSNTDEVLEGAKCTICYVNEREVLFEPCNHVCACEDCAEQIKTNCPICRSPILSKKPIYL